MIMTTSTGEDLISSVIADRFRVVLRIGGGSFGEIYLCVGPHGTEVFEYYCYYI